MKAVILHGTDGSPDENWFPWLKAELEKRGYEVWVPDLPNNHTPNQHVYNDFLLDGHWDFADNLIVGHSSGAVSILNLLSDERCPKISTGVLVGAWSHMEDTDLDREQFKDLFPENGWDFDKLKAKANQFLFLHGSDDPFCPLDQAKYLCEKLNGKIKIVKNGKHFTVKQDPKWTQLPQLIEFMSQEYAIS